MFKVNQKFAIQFLTRSQSREASLGALCSYLLVPVSVRAAAAFCLSWRFSSVDVYGDGIDDCRQRWGHDLRVDGFGWVLSSSTEQAHLNCLAGAAGVYVMAFLITAILNDCGSSLQ